MLKYPFDETVARATGATERSSGPIRSKFRTLVQSPLRAGLLRYLHANARESFEIEMITQVFGQMRVDVEQCLSELVRHDVAHRVAGRPPRFAARVPADETLAALVRDFVADRHGCNDSEQSPSFQRFRQMIGRDEKMLLVFESIRTVAKADISVLILGPTGSGKEVVARMVHELSRRGDENFQAVNCAALPDTLFESELFGYEKGAFTGAHGQKPGRIELANHGTLFLDEVGDLSLLAQAKLLRVVEERRVERLGGQRSIEVDFRLLCATNRPLEQFVRASRFREDLYYRINAFTIRLPALRERPTDIPVLAQRFLSRYCAEQGLPLEAKRFSAEALELLSAYPWPGNIRELESTVSRAALSARTELRSEHIEFLHKRPLKAASPVDRAIRSLREVEADHIQQSLDRLGWNKKKTAGLLKISRETLYRKIAEYDLSPTPEPTALVDRDTSRESLV